MFQGLRHNNRRGNPENDWIPELQHEQDPEHHHIFQSWLLLGTLLAYLFVTVPSASVATDYILGSRDIQDLYGGLASNPIASSPLHIVFYGYFVMSLLFTGSDVFHHSQCYGAIATGDHKAPAVFNCWQLDNLQFLTVGVIICTTAFSSYLHSTFPGNGCPAWLGIKELRVFELFRLLWFPLCRFLSLSLDELYRWQTENEYKVDAAAGLPEEAPGVRRRIAHDAAVRRRVRFAARG